MTLYCWFNKDNNDGRSPSSDKSSVTSHCWPIAKVDETIKVDAKQLVSTIKREAAERVLTTLVEREI